MLEMNTVKDNKILVVDLSGALDSQTSSDFKSWVEEKILDGYRYFSLNFSDLEYLSSRGIAVLLEVQTILRKMKGETVLIHVNDEISRLLRFFHITDTIKVFAGKTEAAAYFQGVELQTPQTVKSKVMESEKSSGVLELSSSEENLEKVAPMIEPSPLQSVAEKPAEQTAQPAEVAPEKPAEVSVAFGVREIFCQNCGTKLKVIKPGKYICPSCRLKFTYGG